MGEHSKGSTTRDYSSITSEDLDISYIYIPGNQMGPLALVPGSFILDRCVYLLCLFRKWFFITYGGTPWQLNMLNSEFTPENPKRKGLSSDYFGAVHGEHLHSLKRIQHLQISSREMRIPTIHFHVLAYPCRKKSQTHLFRLRSFASQYLDLFCWWIFYGL